MPPKPKKWFVSPVGVGAVLLLVVLAIAAGVFFYGRPDKDIARLERMITLAGQACGAFKDEESGAKVSADVGLLLKRVKSEGGVSEYAKKYVGPDKTLPAELRVGESREIRACMDRSMPAIWKQFGIDMTPPKPARVPNPLELRFSLMRPASPDAGKDELLRVNLQTKRRIFDADILKRLDAGFYRSYTAYPDEGDTITGSMIRETLYSRMKNDRANVFCLKRPGALPSFHEEYVHLDCIEGAECVIHKPSPLWLELEQCPLEGEPAKRTSFLAQAFAAEPERSWAVPSVKTLEGNKSKLAGVGYTIFTIETDAFRRPSIIGVEVDLRVNGVPIYEDALPPKLRPVPSSSDRPFRYQFALEPLDFQGVNGGCEAIHLTLTPRLVGKKASDPYAVTLPYVALRSKAEETIPLGRDRLKWSAEYIIPSREWSHIALINYADYAKSAGDTAVADARQRIGRLKERFDALQLKYKGRPLVGVIRPPLAEPKETLAYGLVAGVVQPSGQVRFTFSYTDANDLAEFVIQERSSGRAASDIIHPSKYLYKPAGNKERRATPTAPGVCGYVAAK